MASIKHSSRYPSLDSRSSASSQVSDPSSSSELKNPSKNRSALKRLIAGSGNRRGSPDPVSMAENSSRILSKTKCSDLALPKVKNEQNLSAMVKKFMEKRSMPKTGSNKTQLIIPADFIAEDLKKTGAKGSTFSALPRKLFQKGSSATHRIEAKALTEVKSNTRTLAMVLRSERELLTQNKEYEMEISELKLMLEEKNREVEKLKDLCLKQREEIKSLKSAILFPDVMNSQLQELLEKQGSELKQAKQLIPTLQRQVTSLTGQLQILAEDLAEVKADKFAARACFEGHVNSPKTPSYDQQAANSLEYSSGDSITPGSPDDMLLKDLNPCLTPYYSMMKSKEFEMRGYNSPPEETFESDIQVWEENAVGFQGEKLSKSSEYCQRPRLGSTAALAARRSDENKCTNGKPMHHRLF
ncbi:PREDICTED: uncharacterized protein LOC104594226 [Nelumbo nucifera]|uniref:Uncharacterized protein n=2 Tax=Nelumbo nucifera TaxID=4432 RepID=A0A822XPV5_NELNU|nr:PREDICTED: uncharacterized protein LOC104594226 [Nelumbo nucifera]DAD23634.1 TPA_asm: hypothetical protein HUJ06_025097 [Nelumbo nucifera]